MRPFALAALASAALIPTTASASFVADYQGLVYGTGLGTLTLHNNGGTVASTYAGQFNWQVTSVSGASPLPVGAHFTTFCIDIVQAIHDPTNFTPAGLASAPVGGSNPGGGMGPIRAALIQELYDRFFTQIANATTAAAFQLAIWEIINEDTSTNPFNVGYTTGHGDFYVTNALPEYGNAITQANAWLATLQDPNAPAPSTHYSLTALTTTTYQDQILNLGVEPEVQAVPTPAGLVLALTGVAGFCGFGAHARRRNKLAPVA